jgi:hypothetical protein
MLWIAIPLLLVPFWFGVSHLLATLSGWRELAQEYGAAPLPDIRRKSSGGRVGSVAYNGCLLVGATAEGVALSVLAPFRPGHQAIFIPWSELTVRQDAAAAAGVKLLRFRRAPSVTLELPEATFGWLQSAREPVSRPVP